MSGSEYQLRVRVDRFRLARENGGVYPGAITHGARSAYRNYGCRCNDCMGAHARTVSEQRRRRRQRTEANGGIAPTAVHNASTYSNWSCRCPTCTADATRKELDRRRQELTR